MGYTASFTLHTGKEGVYDITREITSAITDSGIDDGVALIFCPHTTAGIIITENTDSKMPSHDMMLSLSSAFPHMQEFMHSEGNSHAHIKSTVIGCEKTLIVDGGWPLLGPWQAIYFMEFDGPRERHYHVKVIEC